MFQCSKVLTLLAMTVVLPVLIHAQSIRPLTKHSWVKMEVENLSNQPVMKDTGYTRYTFGMKVVDISLNPAWNDKEFIWSYNTAPFLSVGFQTYILEEMTDSTLVIAAPEFRRFRFISEEAYRKLQAAPDTTERFNNHTVYISGKSLTPRLKYNLFSQMSDRMEKFKVGKDPITVRATFVVTDRGKVENVKMVSGMSEGYDSEFVKQIKSTSGDWVPAKIGTQAVYSQVSFEIKYMGSIADPNIGHIY